MSASRRWSVLVALPLLAGACASSDGGSPAPVAEVKPAATAVPAGQEAKVLTVGDRGGYLGAYVESAAGRYLYFFPPTAVCKSLVRTGAAVGYAEGGCGEVFLGERRCKAVGNGTLTAWGARAGAGGGPPSVASYRVKRVDRYWIYLHGSFPLAGSVGAPAYGELIAMTPNSGRCQELVGQQSAPLEYREGEEDTPLALVSVSGDCPIRGLAAPTTGTVGG